MNVKLLRALRTVITVDSDPVRQILFRNLAQSHLPVRLAYRAHGLLAGTWPGAMLVSLYAAAAYVAIGPPRHHGARLLAVATHANARRQVANIAACVGLSQVASVRTGRRVIFSCASAAGLARLLASRRLAQVLHIVRALDRRYGFLVSCRVAAAIAWYARTSAMLAEEKPRAVLVSSDSNPEEIAFVAAARARAIPQVFVSHAYPTPYSPPLDFSLSILEGDAAVATRRRKGPINGDVLLAGVEGESAAFDVRRFERPNPVIGIFTPKALSWGTLVAIIDDCRSHCHASRIVIRWHPSMLERPRLGHHVADLSAIVESDRAASLQEIARQCDWVIADENSNVHLPVLKLGIPTIAIKRLGLYPGSRADLYGLAAGRIVFPAVSSIRDVRADELQAFFAGDWAARFERYDASYLRTRESIAQELRRAILQVCARARVETV